MFVLLSERLPHRCRLLLVLPANRAIRSLILSYTKLRSLTRIGDAQLTVWYLPLPHAHLGALTERLALFHEPHRPGCARPRPSWSRSTDPLEFQIVVSRESAFAGAQRRRSSPRVDLVIPRIGASITNYGLAVVRQFDMMGVPVLNSAVSIARSRDKLRALQLLTRKRIDVPITVCARSPASIDAALEMVGGTPAIVKIQQGTQGIGTMIAETPQAVSSLLETLWAMGQDIVLQEYIEESRGRDIRTIVVGGKVLASMRRTAKAGEFRSNLHRGGLAVKVALPKAYRAAAVAATRVMGLEVAGVDMLEGKDGPKILEINSSPGLEGIERASGVDVASGIITHAERFTQRSPNSRSSRHVMARIDATLADEQRIRRAR